MKLLIEGREAKPEERIRSAIALSKQGIEAGWVCKIGYSQFQEDDRTFKTGVKAGQTIEGKVIDNVWVQGYKEGNVWGAVWHNNKLDHCLYNQRIISIAELRQIIKEDNNA
ncbi:MAG: hypothetical protein EBU08_12230 [Micrococcales bacterium]|nr:hypothetical protein [Micrococcales bacterium]